MTTTARGRRRAVLLLALLALATVLPAGWWLLARPAPARAVRIGYRHSPPFYFAEPGKPPRGLPIDVLTAAAERLRQPIVWTYIGPRSSIEAIEQGEIDLWATMSARPGQPMPLHLTEPWLRSEHFLLMPSGGGIEKVSDLAGRRLAFSAAWADSDLVDRLFPSLNRVHRGTAEEKLLAVCRGEADAALLEGREGQALLLQRPPGCDGIALEFRSVPGAVWPHSIASLPSSTDVAHALRDEIGRMGEDGRLTDILSRWSFTTTNETQLVTALTRSRGRTQALLTISALLLTALVLSLWQVRRSRVARRLAEAATRSIEEQARTQERYRMFFERNAAGVLSTTVDGQVLDANPALARILGYSSVDEVLQLSAWDLYPDASVRRELLSRLAKEGWLANYELSLVRKDRQQVHVVVNATLLDAEPGGMGVVETTLIDVTEQRRLEEQYRQAQKLESIGRLAGGIAHDFNNLLTAITGYTELVIGDLGPDSRHTESMEEIRKAAGQAASLTQQLLAFSRKQLLQPQVLSLDHVVRDSLKLLGRVIGEDVRIETSLESGSSCVEADRNQLIQVLMNLAVNARDAMPQGGRLTIDTRNVVVEARERVTDPDAVLGACVRLSMADTGHGMDADTRRRIFEPFFTTKERGKGTGLGLSTVYGIVKQSGGHISVQSELGQGTRFDIYFPRCEGVVEKARVVARDGVTAGSELLLIVEDQEEVRQLASRALSRQGYRVYSAASGQEALDLCRRLDAPVDLLVSDVVMPGMSGPHLAASLGTRYPELKVLFISGYSDNLLEFGVTPGSVEYLQKPFTPSELAAKVREVLEGSPREDAEGA